MSLIIISILPSLLGVLIGGLVSATTSFLLNSRSNKQQLERDKAAYEQQKERDEVAYQRQIAREQVAFERTVKDAKRERLRSAYKVILNGAEAFLFVIQRVSPIPRHDELDDYLERGLTGTEEALIEITLDDPSTDVKSIFFEVRGIYYTYVAKLRSGGSAGAFNPAEDWKALESKVDELKVAMNRSLKDIDM